MKTKHILTALALPAMFAACTADDIEGLNNGMQQMPERALLSEDFVLNIENGVESRYQVNGTTGLEFIFEAGDSIGANCIDEPKWNGTAWEKDPAKWTILPYVNPALPFVKSADNEWKSAGRPGEGNYLFTNPYNPKDGGRLAAKFELPVVVQYDSKNPNAHIEAYNKAVAADVLYNGDMAANLSLKNLYTYPKVRIHFAKTAEVTKVTKVVLAKGTGAENTGFIYQGGLDHKRIAAMFNPETVEKWLETNKASNVTEEDYWAQIQTSDFIVDGVDDASLTFNNTISRATTEPTLANYAPASYTQYFFYEMNEDVVNFGKTNGIEVRLMLPSIKDFTARNNGIKLYVCTDAGNFVIDFNSSSFEFSEKTLAVQKQQALWRNKANTINTYALTTPNTSDNLQFGNVVTTAADWNKLVERYGDLKKYAADSKEDDKDFVVSLLSDKFSLTSDLKMPEVAEFKINTNVSVAGEVTLKNIKIQTGTLTVKKGATLTTDPTLVAPEVCVEEGGNLVFAAAYNKDKELVAYTNVAKVCNHGTVTVPAGVIAQFELNNAEKGAVLNVGAESRAAEDAVANIYGTNYGVINNNGVINVVEKIKIAENEYALKSLINYAPSNAETVGYKWDTEAEAWDGVPTINNYGKFNATGSTTNYGLFNNDYELSSNFVGNASFVNGTQANQTYPYVGTLKVAAKAKTYIDSNNGGEIVLAELNPTDFTIHKAKKAEQYSNADYGTIKYFLNDKKNSKLELKNSPVTEVVASVDVELANTWTYTGSDSKTKVLALDKLVMNGGTLEIAKTTKAADGTDVPVAKVAELEINGNVLVAETINSVDKITINADATLGVPVNTILSIKDLSVITTNAATEEDEEKEGELIVNGELNLWNVNGDKNGIYGVVDAEGEYSWTNTGSGNITLHKGVMITAKVHDTTASDAAAALQAKYDNAVDQWWKDITETVTWIPTYYNYNPYDVNVFAGLLKNWYDAETDGTRTPMAVALFKEFGFVNATSGAEEATYTALDAEEKLEAIAAKLTDNANFTSAIASKVLTLADTETNKALTNLKAEFIGANSKKEAILKNINISRNEETIYESKEEALTENVYKILAAYGEKNSVNVAKYVNIYQFKTDLATAFSNSTFTNAAGTFDADYAYVWDDCDLDKVVAVMAKVTYEDWKSLGLTTQTNVDNFYSLAGVKEFLRLAYVKGGTTGAAGAAKTVSDTYYDASAEWQYSNDQVKLLAGNKYDIDVVLP